MPRTPPNARWTPGFPVSDARSLTGAAGKRCALPQLLGEGVFFFAQAALGAGLQARTGAPAGTLHLPTSLCVLPLGTSGRPEMAVACHGAPDGQVRCPGLGVRAASASARSFTRATTSAAPSATAPRAS